MVTKAKPFDGLRISERRRQRRRLCCDQAVDRGEDGVVWDPFGEEFGRAIADGQSDWAQNMGTRSRDMVRYYHEYWRECNGGSRFGCSSVTVFIKLLVKPVAGVPSDYPQSKPLPLR